MKEYSKSRPYLITASVLDFICAVAYCAVAIILIVAGLAVIASAGAVADGATSEEVAGAVISAPFIIIIGIFIIIVGALCFIAVIIALSSAITGIVKINKPISELKKSTKVIKASYILNFIATGFFAVAGLVGIGAIDIEDFGASGNGGQLIGGVAAILAVAAVRCVCGVLKVKACKVIDSEEEVKPLPATFFGGEESGNN